MPQATAPSSVHATPQTFIPGIEGMRALAILVVLVYHLIPAWMPAGYLGVDLFYVISGFVITRNALGDLERQRFSLKTFYFRRFRRLSPALTATVLLTVAAGYLVIPPAELAAAAKSGVYALFSLANFNFWWDTSYFDLAAHSKPLLHTWSLSVEEQFYLFWPVALLLVHPTRYRRWLAPGLLLFSLALSFYYREKIPEGLFYLLPFRIHQLMCGAVLAVFSLQLTDRAGNIAALAGGTGFLLASATLNSQTPPFTAAAIISLAGSVLVLGSQSTASQRIYGNYFMQWIGRRSYALYLAHWPLIVLYSYYRDFDISHTERAGLAAASFGAAALLHSFVEKPLRIGGSKKHWVQTSATAITVGIFLAALFVASNFWGFGGFPDRVDPQIQAMVDKLPQEKALRKKAIRYGRCNLHRQHKISDYDRAYCARIDPARKNILVIGDSMAADTYMMLAQTYPGVAISQATAASCTALLHLDKSLYPACRELNELRFRELAMMDFDLVVLASTWSPERIEPLKKTLEFLHNADRNVVIIGPRLTFFASVPTLTSRQISLASVNRRLAQLANREIPLLQQMRQEIPLVPIIDIASIQCDPDCQGIAKGRLLYIDGFHFTRFGARMTGKTLKKQADLLEFLPMPKRKPAEK